MDYEWERCPRCGYENIVGDSNPCSMCLASDELARTEGVPVEEILESGRRGQQREAERQATLSPAERAAELAAAEEAVTRRMQGLDLPPGVPPLEPPVELPCRYLWETDVFDDMVVRFDAQGIRCWNPQSGIQVEFRPWSSVAALNIEGPEVSERRVTFPRAVGLGLLAVLAKKNVTMSYAVMQTTGGSEIFFGVRQMTVYELRAQLSGVTAWHGTYGAIVQDYFP